MLADAYAELDAWAERLGVAPIAPAGALYPPEIADDDGEDVEAYLPIGQPIALPARRARIVLSEVPAARVAVLVHAGSYDSIADTYRRLGAWVAEHAEPRPLPVREIYLVGPSETDDTSRFRTEIQWPITGTPDTGTPDREDHP